MNGIVKAVCISEKKGTSKHNINSVNLTPLGLENDSHAGDWHRQVSLLSYEKVVEFNLKGANVGPGDFGENIVVEGIDFKNLPVGTILKTNNCVLRMTQIGKKCHHDCEIFQRMGECIMPKEGVFAVVVKPGLLSVGDTMTVNLPLRAAIITASDKGAKGMREDKSGKVIKKIAQDYGYLIEEYKILPDEKDVLKEEMSRIADQGIADIIFTTGGTGFSKRDVTPEATSEICERQVPGIPEAMRNYSMTITKRAMLSRGIAGIRKETLIINLPGSPKAVEESLAYIISDLRHGIEVLKGDASECARS